MISNNSQLDLIPGTRDITKRHFCMLNHDFLDAWVPILTPAEFMVFMSVERVANFGTHSSDGYWSVQGCRKFTGLNPDTIRKAMSTCRQLGLIVTVSRPGTTSLNVINQDVMPKPGIIRAGRKWANNLRKGGVSLEEGTSIQASPLTEGSTEQGVGGAESSSPRGSESRGELRAAQRTNKSPINVKTESKADDDDDDRRYFPKLLIDGFGDLGLTLDVGLADRFVKDLWATKPGIEVGEILMIARDRLPAILHNKFVKSHLPYLLKSIVECCIGPTFDNFRRRFQNQKAEEERKHAELLRISAERS